MRAVHEGPPPTARPHHPTRPRRTALGATLALLLPAVLVPLAATSAAAAPTTVGPVGGASLTLSSLEVPLGGSITLDGTGFTTTDGTAGSVVAVKLDRGGVNRPGQTDGVWEWIEADADGTIDAATLTLPDGTTDADGGSTPALATGTYAVHFLTGSGVAGDVVRSLGTTITVTDPAAEPPQSTAEFAVTPGVVAAGGTFRVDGTGLAAGQSVQVLAGDTPLNAEPVAVDGTTVRVADLTLPADAAFGANVLTVVVSDADGEVSRHPVSVVRQHVAAFATAPSRVVAGQDVTVTVTGLAASATIASVDLGGLVQSGPTTTSSSGTLVATLAVPADAAIGSHPVTVTQTAPYAATFTSSVTVDRAFSGAAGFTTTETSLRSGLYQSAYGAASDALFVTAAVGRPPVTDSELVKLDPDTLATVGSVVPALIDPENPAGGVYAVYGVDTDDTAGTVWTTNTRQNTVAVYAQDDLALVKQFPAGAVSHARDVVVDETRHRAYVSAARSTAIAVFDTTTLEQLDSIELTATVDVSPMSLAFDEESGTLVTVSLTTPRAAVVDVSDPDAPVVRGLDLSNATTASGAGYDPVSNRIFVASQGSNNLLVVDAATGATVADVPTGGGALNATYDEVNGYVYVANRTGGSVTVTDVDGTVVANLDTGTSTNHVSVAPDGDAYSVNKGGGRTTGSGDLVVRIAPVAGENPGGGDGGEEPGTETPGTETPGGGDGDGGETPGTETPGTETPGTGTPGTGGSTTVTPLADSSLLTAANRGTGVHVSGTAVPGGTVTVRVDGHEGETVHAFVYSTPVSLGAHVVTDGAITVTLPADLLPGVHHIAVYDAAGALIGWDVLTVTGPVGSLATTGADVLLGAGAALAVALLGAALLLLSRRRVVPRA